MKLSQLASISVIAFCLPLAACGSDESPEIVTAEQALSTWDENIVCPGFTQAPDDGLFKAYHWCRYTLRDFSVTKGKPAKLGDSDTVDTELCMSPPNHSAKFTVGKDTQVTDEVSVTTKVGLSAKIATEASASFAGLAGAKVQQEFAVNTEITGGVKRTRTETLKRSREVTAFGCNNIRYEIYSYDIPFTGKAKVDMEYIVVYKHSESGYTFQVSKGTKTENIDATGKVAIMGNYTRFQSKNLGCDAVHPECPQTRCETAGGEGPGLPGGDDDDDECPPRDLSPVCGDGFCEGGEWDTCWGDCVGSLERENHISYANECARDQGATGTCSDDSDDSDDGGDDGGDNGGGGPPLAP